MNKRKKLAGVDADSVEVSPIKIINQAVANCTPILILHKVRRGGFIYKVFGQIIKFIFVFLII